MRLPSSGYLDAIGQADQARADLEWAEQGKAQARPASGEDLEIEAGAVDEVQEAKVGLGTEVQDAHEAGDPGVAGPTAQADQREKHPHEGAQATTGGPQNQDRL
jgi:hypothetical protein